MGPQWVSVVLGEWLNGGKGLAGKLGGCSGGGLLEGILSSKEVGVWRHPAVRLIEFLVHWHGWQPPLPSPPTSPSYVDPGFVCVYVYLDRVCAVMCEDSKDFCSEEEEKQKKAEQQGLRWVPLFRNL